MARGYIQLTLEAYPEGKAFVSRCRELDVASCGDSLGEALEAVQDAVLVYLSSLETLGERERVFGERGIQILKTKPREIRVESSLPPNGFAGTLLIPVAA